MPHLEGARTYLATTDEVPGGRHGQSSRERGITWPSVPQVADWSGPDADRWVVTALLDMLLTRQPEAGDPALRLARLTPDGAELAVVAPNRGFLDRALGASTLTVWEGVDEDERITAVAVLKGGFAAHRERSLPIWHTEAAAWTFDLWSGASVTLTYEDHEPDADGSPGTWEEEVRLAVKEVGRIAFPSRRIIGCDPCVAGRAVAVELTLQAPGPFPVYMLRLQERFGDGYLPTEGRGVLVVLDESRTPSRWVAAMDSAGASGGGIDSGELAILDREAGAWVEAERLSSAFDPSSPIALVRSPHREDADVCVIRALGGDGPFWTNLGLAEDGTTVAVAISSFDLLALLP